MTLGKGQCPVGTRILQKNTHDSFEDESILLDMASWITSNLSCLIYNVLHKGL